MKKSVVVVGLGQLGAVFSHALLRSGHMVVPVNRGDDLAAVAAAVPEPALVLVAVGEADLEAVLEAMPDAYRDRVALLQNELLPEDWQRHELPATVAVVWFEKKKQKPLHVIQPTPVGGPHAALLVEALRAIDIAADVVDEAGLAAALVVKNLYILTANVAGLAADGSVGALWSEHRALAEGVARDVLALQREMTAVALPGDEVLLAGMVEAFDADPAHGARGRSAPARLARALGHAERLGVDVPQLREIGSRQALG